MCFSGGEGDAENPSLAPEAVLVYSSEERMSLARRLAEQSEAIQDMP